MNAHLKRRWSRFGGQFGDLAKLGSGVCHEADHLPRAGPGRIEELAFDRPHQGEAVSAFGPRAAVEGRPADAGQRALPRFRQLRVIRFDHVASRPHVQRRRPDAKIPFHNKLADLGVELVDLALTGSIGGFRLAGKHRRHPFDGLLLPGVDDGLVHALRRCQLGHCLFPAQRLQGALRLETR